MSYITNCVKIENGKVHLNKEEVFVFDDTQENNVFLKDIYKGLELDYPKFYKMDELCKLALLATEYLMRANPLNENYKPEDVSLFVANASSSLETDSKHQVSIADKDAYFPSPAVFVYTLPNILLGEIGIKYKFVGEQSLFIFEAFDADFMQAYVEQILLNKEAQCAMAGWVEFFENNYKAVLYTIEKEQGELALEHTKENLELIF